jgi:hypothetical protein
MVGSDFGQSYFSRPPHKSVYFWIPTIWLLLNIILALLVGRRIHGRLGTFGLEFMCFSAAAPLILWFRVWQLHAKLYAMTLSSRGSDREDQTRFDVVLTEAAYIGSTGMFIALFGLMTSLWALNSIRL